MRGRREPGPRRREATQLGGRSDDVHRHLDQHRRRVDHLAARDPGALRAGQPDGRGAPVAAGQQRGRTSKRRGVSGPVRAVPGDQRPSPRQRGDRHGEDCRRRPHGQEPGGATLGRPHGAGTAGSTVMSTSCARATARSPTCIAGPPSRHGPGDSPGRRRRPRRGHRRALRPPSHPAARPPAPSARRRPGPHPGTAREPPRRPRRRTEDARHRRARPRHRATWRPRGGAGPPPAPRSRCRRPGPVGGIRASGYGRRDEPWPSLRAVRT